MHEIEFDEELFEQAAASTPVVENNPVDSDKSDENNDTPPPTPSTPTPPPTAAAPEIETDDSDYTPYFEVMKEQGMIIVPDDFKFDGKAETLQKAFDLTKKAQLDEVADELWQSLPEKFKPLLEYGLNGGTSVEDFIAAHGADYTKLDYTKEDDQKKIMTEFYRKTTSHSDEKIRKFIQRLEDAGDLEGEAETTLKELIDLQEDEKAKLTQKAKQENAARERSQQEFVKKLSDTIDDSYKDQAERNKMRAFFFNPIKYQDGSVSTEFESFINVIRSTPSHLVQLADFLRTFDPKKGFDYTRYEVKGQTKANTQFKKLIDQKLTDPKQKLTGSLPASPSTFDYEEFYKHL